MTSSTSTDKAIYIAVPLLTNEEKNTDAIAAEEQLEASSLEEKSPQSHCYKPFLFGVLIGLACYCLVDSHLIPSFKLSNVLANSMATALTWSIVTSALAYSIFWGGWVVLGLKNSVSADQDFFEHMEYYFTLGVFLGFCVACTIDVVMFGIPLLGIMAMVGVAMMWTFAMLKVAPPSKQRATILPMVVV
mmetsp:Transcript_2571/g.3437  ORF Transcript_2571/g.3437 Transcript_2571/m.3437 type:complete len:189 (-) Transcript_2571:123-689(-)|eukprot:CAMPEP_0198138082 /NCGR_PEP_ID=MMETSP1443-20131203/1510_1 /TAXON_ID=186043 /ORGANISM="Entomoneis sp., Strain CCMP2396" /LENGTH=188 /DNA_ID=CAMNT_0043799717 /DNA_START=109 /DNA_END=675 /DNA_ORIENTATION=-